MTTNLNTLSADVASPAAAVRVAVPVISSAGVNDASAIARQQLQNAVPAPALISAYAANVASPPKPPLRMVATQPSSGFVAQLISQSPEMSEADLEIFTPQKAASYIATDESMPNDSLDLMRMARGDFSQAPVKEVSNAPTQLLAKKSEAPQAPAPPNAPPIDVEMRAAYSPAATSLPTVLTQLTKRPSLLSARGVNAYQLTETRNSGDRKPAPALAEATP